MHGAAMPGWLLVALCAVTGASCVARMRRCAGAERTAAAGEALMGFGMAAMAVPFSAPGTWPVYAVVFGAASLHALWWAARRGAGHLHHLVGSLAMVYMAVAMAGGSGGAHAGHGAPGGIPLLTGALLAYYTVYVLRAGARLAPVAVPVAVLVPGAGPGGGAVGGVPGMVLACRVSMGLAMWAMLLSL
ncbi:MULTISPECIES: DUF5134 domain-containing protein [unclassified Streptomyces]|uniref:DUF5134 domain-containing protein n=1 Tax=unclassified Streptomyces TaxID=2593676 RepID=UPI0033A619A0